MGTGPFALPSCERLHSSAHEVVLVVVRPSHASTNKKPPPTPVQSWAERTGLPVFQPANINAPESLEKLAEVGPDLFFVCDYGQILSSECLTIPSLGGVNLHGSLLPRHRGAAPVQWTLLSGDSHAGVSVIHMTPGLDAGPVITRRSVHVLRDENASQLEERLSELGALATMEAVEILTQWDQDGTVGTMQDRSLATKAPRLNKQDGRLDFSLPAVELERRVRGLQPWPGAYGELNLSETKSVSIHLRAARALEGPADPTTNWNDAQVGSVRFSTARQLGLASPEWDRPWDQLLVIKSGRGLLLASSVQPAGKRTMSAAEFIRGHPLSDSAKMAIWA